MKASEVDAFQDSARARIRRKKHQGRTFKGRVRKHMKASEAGVFQGSLRARVRWKKHQCWTFKGRVRKHVPRLGRKVINIPTPDCHMASI